MTTPDDTFESAALAVKQLPEKPDNETLLKLYALYKQATEGNVSGDKPGFFDFVGLAKYEAWERLLGTEQALAREQYIALAHKLAGR